jgi:hypothetical protein
MDLKMELIKAIIKKGKEGGRPLAINEFRDSKAVECPRASWYDKRHPEPELDDENPKEGREYWVDKHGITHVQGAKAVMGTIVHEWIQSQLGHLLLNSEELVNREKDGVIRSGHVDLEYNDDEKGQVISDIKTSNIHVIEAISRGARPDTYSAAKHSCSVLQANEYAVAKDVVFFNILWASRGELAFKIDWYEQDPITDEKIEDTLHEINNFDVDDLIPGKTAMCDLASGRRVVHYCRHHRDYMGWDKSDANCPGRLELAERQKNRKLDDDYEKQDVRADMDALMGE